MLRNNYFYISRRADNQDTTRFDITLNPDHPVYQGHFPGNPICPGVCGIQMIKECVELILEKPLRMGKLTRCRFLAPLSPLDHPDVFITVQLTNLEMGYKVKATVSGTETVTYIDFSAEMQPTL